MTGAALLLAAALMLGAETSTVKIRAGLSISKPARQRPAPPDDPLAAASTFDLLAACLRSGMAVSTAATATAPSAPPLLARLLNRAADLLALGGDPSTAWSNPDLPLDNHAEALLRLARRSASSGAALAQGVTELAAQSRDDAADAASAAAERASVLIAGPLGLCYLPAFLCLGIVPVVVGLAGDVLQSGVL
ncbi:MAG TPA: type II secretion system F family protein [Mycobacterium sp.]|nr:type II secretion system F family protein [Mycobacterium sp.]